MRVEVLPDGSEADGKGKKIKEAGGEVGGLLLRGRGEIAELREIEAKVRGGA